MGPQPARDGSRIVNGLLALSFFSDALATRFFLVLIVPELLYFSIQKYCLNDERVEPSCTFCTVSQTLLCARPSISLALPLVSQNVNQRQWRAGECDRTTTYHQRLSACVRWFGHTVRTAVVQSCCLRCCTTSSEDDGVAG